jgi:hypothetical protein
MNLVNYATDLLAGVVPLKQSNLPSLLSWTMIGAVVGWLCKMFRDARDGRKIYNYLRDSAATTSYRFRSTEAISCAVKLTESRVEHLSIKHRKIKRTTGQKQSWQLTDRGTSPASGK